MAASTCLAQAEMGCWAEDPGSAGLVEEVIVLGGNHAPHEHDDVFGPLVLERLDQGRHQRLWRGTGRKPSSRRRRPSSVHSPPFVGGEIEPAGVGASISTASTRPTSMIFRLSSRPNTTAVREPGGLAMKPGCMTSTRVPSARQSRNGRNGVAWMTSWRFSALIPPPPSKLMFLTIA